MTDVPKSAAARSRVKKRQLLRHLVDFTLDILLSPKGWLDNIDGRVLKTNVEKFEVEFKGRKMMGITYNKNKTLGPQDTHDEVEDYG
jgi:hypothetical protein